MSRRDSSSPRRDLLSIFQAALNSVHGARCVAAALRRRPLPRGRVHVIAIGKAARAMYDGAALAWGGCMAAGLIITKHGHGGPPLHARTPVRLIEAGHPLPDAASLLAGDALLRFLADAPADATLLFLICGGASSLVEALPPGLGLDELRRANAWLLGSGLDIHEVNAVRKALSCIKDGRLSRMLAGRQTLQLLISDVPGDAPGAIGSGLLVQGGAVRLPRVPDWLAAWLERMAPRSPDECFAPVDTAIVASATQAREAAARAARELGYEVHEHAEPVTGNTVEAGAALATQLLEAGPGVHVWCGETTVRLPPRPGRGGRNQSLALSAARALAGQRNVWLLSGATDGTDGPGEDAGALVDGATCARGAADGFDAGDSLAHADAGTFLEASGDLLRTGPTGTNVMDLMLGLKVL